MAQGCADIDDTAAIGEIVGATDQRVVYGQPAEPSEIYGTVALITPEDHSPFCSGTLVAPRVVVTAAHCLVGELSDLKVAAGVLDANQPPSDAIYEVDKVVVHAEYGSFHPTDQAGVGSNFDIGLLVLATNASRMPWQSPFRRDQTTLKRDRKASSQFALTASEESNGDAAED